ncbi:MRL1 [Symbiodinium sp. CCMP2592]|nr:MRL1 [Symbiodinium sp. CCMP2592]
MLSKLHSLQDPSCLLELLGFVSDWFGSLYEDGYVHAGKTWKFLVQGLKGDLVFQAKACSLVRNFARVQKQVQKATSKPLLGLCCWCMAGTSTCGFEDFSRNPAWLTTAAENNPAPWPVPPTILRSIPHMPDAPSFLKVDLFHTLNLGAYKEFAASSLVLLLPYFEGTNNDDRILSLNAHLQVYLKETRQRLHCGKLTLENIGAKTKTIFATGSWNKGEDSVVLMKFLPWAMDIMDTVNAMEKPWRYIDVGARAAGQCMRTLYSAEAFMPKKDAQLAADSGFTFLQAYSKLVEWSMQHNLLLYNLIPKLHFFHHCLVDLMNACAQENLSCVLNPIVNSTPQCEDMALALLLGMERSRVQADVIAYNAAISSCEKAAVWEVALVLLPWLRARELQPDTISFNAAISACQKRREWLWALELIREAEDQHVRLSSVSFNAAISACDSATAWQRAPNLLQAFRMTEMRQDIVSYNAAISACENGSQWRLALQLLHEATCMRMEPDSITYLAVISTSEKVAQWTVVLWLLASAYCARVVLDSSLYNAAAAACSRASEWAPDAPQEEPKVADPRAVEDDSTPNVSFDASLIGAIVLLLPLAAVLAGRFE